MNQDFIYDKNGNLVNVLPAGTSTDVLAQNYLSQTNTPIQPIGPIEEQVYSNSIFPVLKANTVFGYSRNPNPEDLDIHKITTVFPLVQEDFAQPKGDAVVAQPKPMNAEKLPMNGRSGVSRFW
jgi:hypothetical protein